MKVLHVITGLSDGGAEAVLYQLLLHDSTNSHYVISLTDEGKYGGYLREANVQVTTLEMPRGQITLHGLYRLWRVVRSTRPDVIQTWMYHADLIGGVLARLAGIRRICWGVHNSALDKKLTKRSTILVAKLCAIASQWIPTTIICCAQKAKETHQEMGYASNKLEVIVNGYDLSRFSIDGNARMRLRSEWGVGERCLLGFVGRFDPMKDHRNLLEALMILKQHNVDFLTILVGHGVDYDNDTLVRWIKELMLQNNVLLLGQRVDIPDVMNALDIHVLPSSSEAFPNVVAEAMACGTPTVVTDVGDAAKMVGGTGWVAPPKNPSALAHILLQAQNEMKKEETWAERRFAARLRIEKNFSLPKMLANYEAAWRGSARTNENNNP